MYGGDAVFGRSESSECSINIAASDGPLVVGFTPTYEYVGYGGLNGVGIGSPPDCGQRVGTPNAFPFFGVGGKFTHTSSTSFASQVMMCGNSIWGGGICNTPSGNRPAGLGCQGAGSFMLYVSNLPAGEYLFTINYFVFVYTTATFGGASGSVSYQGASRWTTLNDIRRRGGDRLDLQHISYRVRGTSSWGGLDSMCRWRNTC